MRIRRLPSQREGPWGRQHGITPFFGENNGPPSRTGPRRDLSGERSTPFPTPFPPSGTKTPRLFLLDFFFFPPGGAFFSPGSSPMNPPVGEDDWDARLQGKNVVFFAPPLPLFFFSPRLCSAFPLGAPSSFPLPRLSPFFLFSQFRPNPQS